MCEDSFFWYTAQCVHKDLFRQKKTTESVNRIKTKLTNQAQKKKAK